MAKADRRIRLPRLKISSIADQLRISFGLIVILNLLIVAAVLIYMSFQTQKKQLEVLQQERSRAVAAEINAYLEDLHRKLGYLARVPGLTVFSSETQGRLLEGLVRHNGAYEAVAILNNTGRVVSSVAPHNQMASDNFAGSLLYVHAFKQEDDFFSEVETDPGSHLPLLTIAVPVRNREDKVDGVLLARVNLNYLWFTISQFRVGETGYAYIVDNRGFLIAKKGDVPEGFQLEDISDRPFIRDLVLDIKGTSKPATTYQGLEGLEVLGASAPIEGVRWNVVVELPIDEAYAPIKDMILAMGKAVVAVVVVVIGLGIFLSRWIARPLRRLTEAAAQISAGNIDTRVNIKSGNEIGVLAKAFNEMGTKLTEAHSNLEQKVRKRTEELEEAKGRLEQEVAERRQAEEALKHKAQELTRSNSELEQFAYVASHDLQEPLRKIQSFGDLLTSKSGDALNDQGRDYLGRMKGAASRMQDLINGLLTFSRVTTQAQPHTLVNLQELTQGVLSDLEVRIQESGGLVEVGDLPVVEADALQMRQLMQNLISNALKFQKPEEPPVVKVESRFISSTNGTSDQAALCELTVQDNGIGFDEKYADRIFGVFQRLHGRGAYEGTGIGLATCEKIVERHGGTITTMSAPGEGATFIVTLPIKQPGGE